MTTDLHSTDGRSTKPPSAETPTVASSPASVNICFEPGAHPLPDYELIRFVVNAAGCLTLLAVYPFTTLRASWLYTTMGSASAGAQGVRDALDVLRAKRRLPADEDLKVVVVAGDGSTLDIGFSALSGAIYRGLDFYYLCYDNEVYGNTGFQMSSSSPFASQTATTLAGDGEPIAGVHQRKKDLFEIWRAHQPPYIATLSAADPVDFADKVQRASAYPGPKLFTALAVCPPGWAMSHARAITSRSWPSTPESGL